MEKFLKIVSVFLVVYIIISVFYYSSATFSGDSTYTDPNNTLFLSYDDINNRLIKVLQEDSSSSLLTYMKDSSYKFYVYYGEPNGSSMLNGSTYNTSKLNVLIYPVSTSIKSQAFFENYLGIFTNIVQITNPVIRYTWVSGQGWSSYQDTSTNYYLPSAFINYVNDNLLSFLYDDSSSQTSSIVNAIEEQTNTINEQTNTIKQGQDKFFSNDVEDSSISIIEDNNDDITSDGFNNLFTTLQNAFLSENYRDISLPIPHTSNSINISSNLVENMLGSDNWILNFIHLFYYFLLGLFITKDIERIIDKVKSGDIMTSSEGNIKANMV